MLTNLPTYCRNAAATSYTSIIDDLTYTKYYSQKGRPPYSSKALRFALILRYTSLVSNDALVSNDGKINFLQKMSNWTQKSMA